MSLISTSALQFKGFKSIVKSTNNWFTQNKSINLTEAVYGKPQPNIIQKTFNLVKWMRRISAIKKKMQRMKKLVKMLNKVAKFGAKIGKFLFKVIKFLVKIGIKYVAKPVWTACKWIGKGVFKGFKFATTKIVDSLKWIVEKVGKLAKKIIAGILKFVKNKLIKPIVKKIMKWLPKLKAIIAPFITGVKELFKRGFKNIKNFIVGGGAKRMFNSGKTLIVESGKHVKGFIGGTIKFFKSGTSKVLMKVMGLGKDAKDLAVVAKDGSVISKGKGAVDWLKYTKKKGKWGLKFVKQAFSNKWKTFMKINKIGKTVIATIKFIFKILKFILTGAKLALKPISSTIATGLSAPSFGLSFIFPLVMGLIFESFEYIPKLMDNITNPIQWLYHLGWYVLSILGWINPIVGFAIALKQLRDLLSSSPSIWTWMKFIFSGFDTKVLEEAAGLKETGLDVIFNDSTAQRLDTIKDLQKHTLTSQILLAKNTTDKFNNIAIDIINLISTEQINRSKNITKCVSLI